MTYPMQLINSNGWKLTLPVGSPGNPTELTVGGSPDLLTYSSEWFHLNAAGDGVVFRARTDGVTTSGSNNPRSELREMSPDGQSQAAWSSTVGVHTMEIVQAVNALPIGSKPVVVVGQIHDAHDDIAVFRVEGNKSGDRNIASIWITDGNTSHGKQLASNYRLGEKFSVGYSVTGGVISFTFNGQPVSGYTQTKSFSGAYFKAGSYNQSGGNITRLPDGTADYADVTIYSVKVCHDGVCSGGSSVPIVVVVPPSTPPVVTPPTGVSLPRNIKFKPVKASLAQSILAALDARFTALGMPAPDVGVTVKQTTKRETVTIDSGPRILALVNALPSNNV